MSQSLTKPIQNEKQLTLNEALCLWILGEINEEAGKVIDEWIETYGETLED